MDGQNLTLLAQFHPFCIILFRKRLKGFTVFPIYKMEQGLKLYERTRYPKIFKGSYWGGHIQDHPGDDEVIENRNQFIPEYGITRRISDVPQYIRKILGTYGGIKNSLLDHIEVYYNFNAKQYIIIVSPYIWPERNEDWEKAIEYFSSNNFKLYKPLYAKSASTFIRVINKGAKVYKK